MLGVPQCRVRLGADVHWPGSEEDLVASGQSWRK